MSFLTWKSVFYDNFESNLSQWTGRFKDSHSGFITKDPLQRDHALSFSELEGGGDIYTKNSFKSPLGVYRLSFDYLGLARSGSVTDDLGGFIGYAKSLNESVNTLDSWLVSTDSTYNNGNVFHLKDTGRWQPVSITFTTVSGSLNSGQNIFLTLEDWYGSGGVTGDVFFDNIHLEALVEVSSHLIQGGSNSDKLVGSNANEIINGRAGQDTLIGGGGADQLNGGSGEDILTGGGGKDKFIYDTGRKFRSGDVGVDQITDFVRGDDKIVLDKTTFTSLDSRIGEGFSVLREFAVVSSNSAAETSRAEIVFNSSNGRLFYNPNRTATGFGEGGQFATLTGVSNLSRSDFLIQ